jgi:hypothetical protein
MGVKFFITLHPRNFGVKAEPGFVQRKSDLSGT